MLPLILLAGYSVYWRNEHEKKEVHDRALQQAEFAQRELSEFTEHTQSNLLILTGMIDTYQGDMDQLGKYFTRIKGQFHTADFPEYENIFFADRNGKAVASAIPLAEPVNIADQEYFRLAASTGKSAISDITVSRWTSLPAIVFVYPVTQQGQFAGVLGVTIPADQIAAWAAGPGLPGEAVITIVDQHGHVVSRNPEPLAWIGRNIGDLPLSKKALEVGNGIWEGQGYDGKEVLLASRSLADVPWQIVIAIPMDEAMAETRLLMLAYLGLIAIAFLFALALAHFLGRSLTKPIVRLASAARKIGGGTPLSQGSEVNELARALDQLLKSTRESHERLEQRNTQLQTLRRIDLAIISVLNTREAAIALLDNVADLPYVDAASIMFCPNGNKEPEVVSRNLRSELFHRGCLEFLKQIAQRAVEDRKLLFVSNLSQEPGFVYPTEATDRPLASYLGTPLITRDRVIGVLNVYTRSPHDFDEEERGFFTTLSTQAAIAMDNAHLYEQQQQRTTMLEMLNCRLEEEQHRLEEAYTQMVQALVMFLETRDRYTRGHSERVSRYAKNIANVLELTAEETRVIVQAARLHDLGKIATPDGILNKPGPLTPAEWSEIELHPQRSAETLQFLPFLKEEMKIIRSHHERWDGKGYPDGLAGEVIPLGARILAVSDAYDAMTIDRPYRRALSHAEAVIELKKGSGKQFDPRMVEAFLAALHTESQMVPDM